MKIAILTSGGDAPGMNALIINLINYAFDKKYEVYLIEDGYKGLAENNFYKVNNPYEYSKYLFDSGSFIYCSRYPKWKENWKIGLDNLINNGIDCLIVIGGNGSYKGVQLLSKYIKTIFIPGTIDNDVDFSDYCIGFASAISEVVTQSKKIISTFKTHKNIVILEVMGRHCSDLTNEAAKALNPSLVINHENKLSIDEILQKIINYYQNNKFAFILLAEHTLNQEQIKEIINSLETKLDCSPRFSVLGYSQRGANVDPFDLSMANKMSEHAIKLIEKNDLNKAIHVQNNNLISSKYDDLEGK